MSDARSWGIRAAILVVVAVVASIRVSGEAIGSRLLSSLRIARPKAVTVNGPSPTSISSLASSIACSAATSANCVTRSYWFDSLAGQWADASKATWAATIAFGTPAEVSPTSATADRRSPQHRGRIASTRGR